MANTLLAFNNRADSATLSNGSWIPSLPLSNLGNRELGEVARSTDLLTASTKFDVDIGSDKPVRMIALVAHNLSLDAKIRIRAGTDPTFAVVAYDGGWGFVWPVVYGDGTLEWESPNFWSGQYLEEERQGYNWSVARVFAEAAVTCRYFRVEIDDPLNTNGYVDIGRLFIADAWQPQVNVSNGAGIGWETDTGVQKALSGAEFFDHRTPYRVATFNTDWMLDDEAMSNAFDIQRRVGVDLEIFYMFDPEDTVHALRRQFLGRLRKLSPIESANFLLRKTGWEVKELL